MTGYYEPRCAAPRNAAGRSRPRSTACRPTCSRSIWPGSSRLSRRAPAREAGAARCASTARAPRSATAAGLRATNWSGSTIRSRRSSCRCRVRSSAVRGRRAWCGWATPTRTAIVLIDGRWLIEQGELSAEQTSMHRHQGDDRIAIRRAPRNSSTVNPSGGFFRDCARRSERRSGRRAQCAADSRVTRWLPMPATFRSARRLSFDRSTRIPARHCCARCWRRTQGARSVGRCASTFLGLRRRSRPGRRPPESRGQCLAAGAEEARRSRCSGVDLALDSLNAISCWWRRGAARSIRSGSLRRRVCHRQR